LYMCCDGVLFDEMTDLRNILVKTILSYDNLISLIYSWMSQR
jgi:hypothetical protein